MPVAIVRSGERSPATCGRDPRRRVVDRATRAVYATDASNYRQVPLGVVCPLDVDDVIAAMRICAEHDVPVLARGAGTSLAGQAVNVAVILDTSRHMRAILEIDPDRRIARVQPGPDPATHAWCTLGGMLGNDSCCTHALVAGRTVDNVERLSVVTYGGHSMEVGSYPLGANDGEVDPIAAPMLGKLAIVGYAQLRAALSTAVGSPAMVSSAVRSVLRSCQTVEELDAVLPGVARALDQAGLALHVSEARIGRTRSSVAGRSGLTWADLRCAGNPTAAAAIALLGVSLTLRDVCLVRVIDIATDGAWVADASGFRPLALASRPFVVATRLLRVEAGAGPEDRFIVSHGRQIGPAALARLVTATFAGLGVAIDAYELRRQVSRTSVGCASADCS